MSSVQELYLFQYNGANYGFNPGFSTIIFGGISYYPAIIKRANLQITNNFNKNVTSFSFERTHSFARLILQNLAETHVLVTIYRNGSTYWKGRVINSTANLLTIDLDCDSFFRSLDIAGFAKTVSIHCRHKLYDGNCRLNQALWTDHFTVNNLNSNSITILGLSKPDNYYTGGIASLNGQSRLINSHVGTNIKIEFPFYGVQTGTLGLSAGCSLIRNDTVLGCKAKNNELNFGGMDFMPSKNPFTNTGAF